MEVGNLFIADTGNARIRKVTPAGIITTVAGTGEFGFSGDGGLLPRPAFLPVDVAVDGAGNLFIADTFNHRIRKVTPAGIISTVAGDGIGGFSGDFGPAAAARLNGPTSVAVDAEGNLFIADSTNRRIRKVTYSPTAIPASLPDFGRLSQFRPDPWRHSHSSPGSKLPNRFNRPPRWSGSLGTHLQECRRVPDSHRP